MAVAALLASAFVGALVLASPSSAHPFGPPQTVAIGVADADGTVRVQWRPGGADDFSYLAVGIGLVAEDRSMHAGGILFVKADADVLGASAEFTTYVSDHIAMSGDGAPCPGAIGSTSRLMSEGVTVTFACAGPIARAELEVTMLTDLNPAYRTLATGPFGQRFVYTAEQQRHGWSFDASAAGAADGAALGRSAIVQIAAVITGLTAAVLAGVLLRRRHAKAVAA
jgi:hypothetical protein